MGRVWVLDTETKGTGAEMVPLDKVLKKQAPSKEPIFARPSRRRASRSRRSHGRRCGSRSST